MGQSLHKVKALIIQSFPRSSGTLGTKPLTHERLGDTLPGNEPRPFVLLSLQAPAVLTQDSQCGEPADLSAFACPLLPPVGAQSIPSLFCQALTPLLHNSLHAKIYLLYSTVT